MTHFFDPLLWQNARKANDEGITITSMNVSQCDEISFPKLYEMGEFVKNRYTCIDISTASLYGGWKYDNMQHLNLAFYKCDSEFHDNCDTEINIADVLANSFYDYIIQHDYFDKDDFDNPIKTIVNNDLYSSFSTDANLFFNLFVRRNKYELYDSVWGSWGEKKEGYFYTIDKTVSMDNTRYGGKLSTVALVYDQIEETYVRRVATIGPVFSNILVIGLFSYIFLIFIMKIVTLYLLESSLCTMLLKSSSKVSKSGYEVPSLDDADLGQMEGGEPEQVFFEEFVSEFNKGRSHFSDIFYTYDSVTVSTKRKKLKGAKYVKESLDAVKLIQTIEDLKFLLIYLLKKDLDRQDEVEVPTKSKGKDGKKQPEGPKGQRQGKITPVSSNANVGGVRMQRYQQYIVNNSPKVEEEKTPVLQRDMHKELDSLEVSQLNKNPNKNTNIGSAQNAGGHQKYSINQKPMKQVQVEDEVHLIKRKKSSYWYGNDNNDK